MQQAAFVGYGARSLGIAALAWSILVACGPTPTGGGAGGTGGAADPCRVSAVNGELRGKAVGTTCEYLGVPYAAPPTGTLRFAPPKPAPAWTGVRDVVSFGPWCTQAPLLGVTTSEDCLSLNVYAPKAAPATPLPVMVFIHGGGFKAGAGSIYDAQELSERGPALIVTINYRLGPLGFLALPELDLERGSNPSGADGIRDQQLALEWVRDNAAHFHGDPNNVTVFGESAGSHSACLHLVSPRAHGLARRFIMESGFLCTVPGAVATRAQAHTVGAELARSFCSGQSDVLGCLRRVDPAALAAWTPKTSANALGIDFVPVIDGPGGVIPDAPMKLIERGEYERDAAIVAGNNKYEWGLFDSPLYTPTTVSALQQAIEQAFGPLASEIKALYPVGSDADAQHVFDTLMTDLLMRCRTRDLARATVAQGTRFFLYSYDVGRAFHADELFGLFHVEINAATLFMLGATIPSPSFRSSMKGYWTRFAAAGDPNGEGAPTWPKFELANEGHMTLVDPASTAGADLQRAQCEFWAAHDYPNAGAPPAAP